MRWTIIWEPYIENITIPPRFWAKKERVVVLPNDMSTFAEDPTENDMVVYVCLERGWNMEMEGRRIERTSCKNLTPQKSSIYEFRRTNKKYGANAPPPTVGLRKNPFVDFCPFWKKIHKKIHKIHKSKFGPYLHEMMLLRAIQSIYLISMIKSSSKTPF